MQPSPRQRRRRETNAVSVPAPGATFVCRWCGTAVLLVSGSVAELWCHDDRMLIRNGIRCSEPVCTRATAGLVVGRIYVDRPNTARLRCTRGGSGLPSSRAGELLRLEDRSA